MSVGTAPANARYWSDTFCRRRGVENIIRNVAEELILPCDSLERRPHSDTMGGDVSVLATSCRAGEGEVKLQPTFVDY